MTASDATLRGNTSNPTAGTAGREDTTLAAILARYHMDTVEELDAYLMLTERDLVKLLDAPTPASAVGPEDVTLTRAIAAVIAREGVLEFDGLRRLGLAKMIAQEMGEARRAPEGARETPVCPCDIKWDINCPAHGNFTNLPTAAPEGREEAHEYQPRDCGGWCEVCGHGKSAHQPPAAPTEGTAEPVSAFKVVGEWATWGEAPIDGQSVVGNAALRIQAGADPVTVLTEVWAMGRRTPDEATKAAVERDSIVVACLNTLVMRARGGGHVMLYVDENRCFAARLIRADGSGIEFGRWGSLREAIAAGVGKDHVAAVQAPPPATGAE